MFLEKIKGILICPHCQNSLDGLDKEDQKSFFCKKCSKNYPYQNKKIFFIEPEEFKTKNWLDKIKNIFKKDRILYKFLVNIISPVYPDLPCQIKKWLKRFGQEEIIVDIGSGTNRFNKKTINLDVFPYPEVDILADANRLPFKDESVDGLISIAVLEHLKRPEQAVKEFYRVLRKKGGFFVFVPFLQGFHASPEDYYRWTKEGARCLFEEFSEVKIVVAEGPTSSLLWNLQEWLALTFSFYNRHIYRFLLILIMILTFPLKFLDIFLKHHPEAGNTTSGFYVMGKK